MSEPDRSELVRHRQILAARPELERVYRAWFRRLLSALNGCEPIVEIGAGPGLLKSQAPLAVSTDVVVLPWVDVVCDAAFLPFRSETIGGLVMVDVLHHLPRPLRFLAEAARVLRVGGRMAVIEPWISPLSYVMYRAFHYERCRLRVDLALPFGDDAKGPLDGNSALSYRILRALSDLDLPFRVVEMDRFVALPYLVTFGFRVSWRLPSVTVWVAEALERAINPLARWVAATRVLAVLEKIENGQASAP